MKDKYGISVWKDVESLDFDAVRETLVGLEYAMNDIPGLKGKVQNVKTGRSGVMSCNGTDVTFNPNYYNSKKRIDDEISTCTKSGWWPPNTSRASIAVHECSHAFESVTIDANSAYTSRYERVIAWNNCTEAKAVVSQACKNVKKTEYGKGKKNEELKGAISGYAKTNPSETWAEAFADCYANGENANPLSKEIRRLAIERYNNHLGGTT